MQNIEGIMESLHVIKNGNKINTFGKFHIHSVTRLGNSISDKGKSNAMPYSTQ